MCSFVAVLYLNTVCEAVQLYCDFLTLGRFYSPVRTGERPEIKVRHSVHVCLSPSVRLAVWVCGLVDCWRVIKGMSVSQPALALIDMKDHRHKKKADESWQTALFGSAIVGVSFRSGIENHSGSPTPPYGGSRCN